MGSNNARGVALRGGNKWITAKKSAHRDSIATVTGSRQKEADEIKDGQRTEIIHNVSASQNFVKKEKNSILLQYI